MLAHRLPASHPSSNHQHYDDNYSRDLFEQCSRKLKFHLFTLVTNHCECIPRLRLQEFKFLTRVRTLGFTE